MNFVNIKSVNLFNKILFSNEKLFKNNLSITLIISNFKLTINSITL